MNYINQLNSFYDLLYSNPLSSTAICLYVILFHINNKCNWQERFTAANMTIQGLSAISRNQLNQARNELIQKGYIKYQKGSGNQCGSYLLVRFSTQTDTQSGTQTDTQSSTQIDTQTQQKEGTLIKLNKTKLNKTNKEKIKEKHGEYGNVLLTEKELQSLNSDFPNSLELIKFLDEYIEMKDYKAKSHYLAIKKWVVNAVEEQKNKENNSEKQRELQKEKNRIAVEEAIKRGEI